MMRRTLCCLLIVLCAADATLDGWAAPDEVGTACSNAVGEIPEPSVNPRSGVSWYRDILYRDGAVMNPIKHRLDIYLPAEDNWHDGRPLLVWIHGGGWTIGDKDDAFGVYGRYCRLLAEHGVAAANISYRLSPAVTHPGHIEDVAAAIGWLVRQAETFGYDAERLFISGHSAGAHLAALAAVDDRYLLAAGVEPEAVCGVIPSSGVFDLTTLFRGVSPLAAFTRFNAADASPVSHVDADDPPFLFIVESHGGYMRRQTDQMIALLRRAGVDSERVEIENSNHITMMGDLARRDGVHLASTLRFIENVLAGQDHDDETGARD